MPNVTFPCPFCAKKMAVAEAMLGKKVRCPSCKQVVLAPTSATNPAPSPPPPPTKPVPAKITPTQPAAFDDLPVFNVQPRESHESIFSPPEESEDEIFGSHPGVNLRVPEMPSEEPPKITPIPVPVPVPVDDNPFGFTDEPPPSPPPTAKPKAPPLVVEEAQPTADFTDPFGGFEDPPPQPIPEPIPEVTISPPLVAVPVPQSIAPKVAAVIDDEDDEPRPERTKPQPSRRPPAVSHEGTGPGMGFYILLGYAVLMTAMTLYGFLFRYGTQLDPGHPLSTIPDNFGEFPPAERKKTGQLNKFIDGELPPQLRVALGRKIEIGQLEIEPIKVETRQLTILSDRGKGEPMERTTSQPAVVMTLQIRNTSNELTIHPMDPAFTRKFVGNTDEAKPGTALVVGKDVFRGGELPWPPTGRTAALREFEQGQKDDANPLKPGESRTYVVFTAADKKIVDKVKSATEPLLWRVQVRRGVIDFKGKSVPVTAVIGVEFKAGNLKEG